MESTYNYDRGGDIDELRIYDRMLSDDNVAGAGEGRDAADDSAGDRSLAERCSSGDEAATASWQQEWWYRYGWNRPDDIPAPLPAEQTTVRKVEIHDAYDLKRWWWKGTDGIRETTWPGVYNRSKLAGPVRLFPASGLGLLLGVGQVGDVLYAGRAVEPS